MGTNAFVIIISLGRNGVNLVFGLSELDVDLDALQFSRKGLNGPFRFVYRLLEMRGPKGSAALRAFDTRPLQLANRPLRLGLASKAGNPDLLSVKEAIHVPFLSLGTRNDDPSGIPGNSGVALATSRRTEYGTIGTNSFCPQEAEHVALGSGGCLEVNQAEVSRVMTQLSHAELTAAFASCQQGSQ
jgi:hypothetical protein